MFSFWSSNSRGSEQTAAAVVQQPMPHIFAKDLIETPVTSPVPTSVHPLKRKTPSLEDATLNTAHVPPPTKRARIEHNVATPPETPAVAHKEYFPPRTASQVTADVEKAREAIQYQFGLEILLKHDELRLINQELAKCQVALEQLRRCHLMPYPVSCPTPQQMLDISSGKGPAVQTNPGEAVPKWAAPFGVVDGPYARHYAKWLIPDPVFDGPQADWQAMPDMGKMRNVMEGRTTRNSLSDATGVTGKRAGRGLAGQKLQALSNGYPQPKEKAGPCVLKRSDGQTVKLVCIDCQRENFSSTQGFINHCRIAHRRDFKSHEEAAVHCGHPIEVDEGGGVVGGEEKPTASSASGLVHPLARTNAADDKEVYATLRSRIAASLKLYEAGKLPGVMHIPGAPASSPVAKGDKKPSKSFISASDTPYLSKLMQNRNFNGNLSDHVQDAKTKTDLNELFSPGEDSDSELPSSADVTRSPSAIPTARTPAVMRIPARMSSPPPASTGRPSSSKSRSPHLTFATKAPVDSAATPGAESPGYDEMDVELSPNTMASNNAPSLVSDDGEYDDSDDGTSSETSENMETESVSDVAEITLDEDPDAHDTTRHHRGSTSTAVKLKKEESKHVTFVSPVRGNPKGRPRKQKA